MIYGFDENVGGGWLYPLTSGLLVFSCFIPRYIDFSEVDSVQFVPYPGKGGFDLCVKKKAGEYSTAFIRMLSIANREYPLLREYLAEKGVTMEGEV